MKRFIILIICCTWLYPQGADSLKSKSPAKAALYGAMFPGGGQVYNGRWLKPKISLFKQMAW